MDRRSFVAGMMAAGVAAPALAQTRRAASRGGQMAEAAALQATAAREAGRAFYRPGAGTRFRREDNVFLASALAVDFTYRAAKVTLPLYRGRTPDGQDAWYIVTEASDFQVARTLGVNYAPKMRHAAGTPGAMAVQIAGGTMIFPGGVDFSPSYAVVPGPPPTYFPPQSFTVGAVGDAAWSSMAVLPSGQVLNVQMVGNRSGRHDRALQIDERRRTVDMSLLDGFHAGKQYYYHLVTDVSADLPSVLEKGVFTPRLAMVPGRGQSGPSSAQLGFSPVLNGRTEIGSGQDQGFSTSLRNGGIDPINVFPLAPNNANRSIGNNYSPLWDAHVSMWTPAAVQAGRVRRVTSLQDLTRLVRSGDMTSAMINPPGPGNAFVAGLRPTRAIINCPVIAQPNLPPR